MYDDVCILRRNEGPWWWRDREVATVICGRVQVEHYLRIGYQYDWKATDEARGAA